MSYIRGVVGRWGGGGGGGGRFAADHLIGSSPI